MIFGNIELDLERFELRRDGAPVSVEPKVFDVIRHLAENANRLVTKDELIEGVWNGRIVSDAALSSAIKSARRAIGDTDVSSSRIKTVHGRGFRLELPEEQAAAPLAEPVDVFVQPSFVMLPPRALPPDCDGTTLQRRISSAAAGIPFLTVIAPAIARRLGDAAPEDLARTVGHGYALEVSGHDGGLDCILFNVGTSATIWSHTCPNGDTESVAAHIISRLEPQIVKAIHSALSMSPDPGSAQALTLRALGTMSLKGWNSSAFAEAEDLLRRAVKAAPELGHAHAALGLVLALGQRIGLVEPDEARRSEAIAHADKAIELDPMTPNILGLAGCALVDAGQALRGRAVLERGVSMDPGNAQSLAALGTAKISEKQFDEAIAMLSKAISISPNDGRIAVWGSMLALAYMITGDFERASQEAERAVAMDDRTHLSRIVLSAVALKKGDRDAAHAAWVDAHRVTPDLSEAQIAAVVGPNRARQLGQTFA